MMNLVQQVAGTWMIRTISSMLQKVVDIVMPEDSRSLISPPRRKWQDIT